MWIKEFNGQYDESLVENVNFLFKQDNIYIMDNHLCAAWCWLQEIQDLENNNLIHIDRHYDLLNHPNIVRTTIIEPSINLQELTFEEYQNLGAINRNDEFDKTFRWDNYILNLREVYTNYYGRTIFSTFDLGNQNPDFINDEISFQSFLNNIEDDIRERPEEKWILNIDIDYFFNTLYEKRIQVFSDDFVKLFAEKILSILDNISVVTFCLSPECCGGWDPSLRLINIFCEVLNIDFQLPPN